MPSKVFRTVSSTVVQLKNGALLEVRRGDERGSKFPDPRTWESQEAWLTAVGEPLIPEAPLGADIELVAKLSRKYRHYKGESGLFMTDGNTPEQKKLVSDLRKVSHILTYLNRPRTCEFRIHNLYKDVVDGTVSQNPLAAPVISEEEYLRYRDRFNALLPILQAKVVENAKKRKTDIAEGRVHDYFMPFGKPSLYVGCEDGDIQPVYYNATYNVCGVHGEKYWDFHVGRSFTELGIRPVAWYAVDIVTRVLKKITDLS